MGFDKFSRKRKGKRVAQSYYAKARRKPRLWWPTSVPYVENVETPPEPKEESEPTERRRKRRPSKEEIPNGTHSLGLGRRKRQ